MEGIDCAKLAPFVGQASAETPARCVFWERIFAALGAPESNANQSAGNAILPSMFHPFPGMSGLALGALTGAVVATISYKFKKFEAYNLDPLNERGALEPFLAKYIRTAEFVIGLASGSIVLLVGSSAFHGQNGHLPWIYASPLLLLCWCVLYGVVFMVWLILSYEEHRHGNPHTRLAYTCSETLGFSSLLCFWMGYVWLVIAVTR
jgi:hypothetical protein